MKRVAASSNPGVSYVVYYGAPFARKTKKFKNMKELRDWLHSCIFLAGEPISVKEVRDVDVEYDTIYMNHYDIKERALSRRLFETGIISRSDFDLSNSEVET